MRWHATTSFECKYFKNQWWTDIEKGHAEGTFDGATPAPQSNKNAGEEEEWNASKGKKVTIMNKHEAP